MARFRAEAALMPASDDEGLRADMALVLAEMVAEAIEDAHLKPHDRVEVRISWEPASVRAVVRYPAAQPDLARDSTIRDQIVSSLAASHGLAWSGGHVRRWVEFRRPRWSGAEDGHDLQP